MQKILTYFIFSILVLGAQPTFGMDPEAEMTPIKQWEDAVPFAGLIVVYSADSLYFGKKNGYEIDSESNLRVALIDEEVSRWRNEEIGYSMARLLKVDSVSRNCALTNSKLKKRNVTMRLPRDEEKHKIAQAFRTKEAVLDYHSFTRTEFERLIESWDE